MICHSSFHFSFSVNPCNISRAQSTLDVANLPTSIKNESLADAQVLASLGFIAQQVSSNG